MHCCKHICGLIKTRFAVLAATLLMISAQLQAQSEKYIQSLTGEIKAGDSCVVVDDKFVDAQKWGSIQKHRSVNNLVTFEIRYDTSANFLTKKFSCKLELDIEYEQADRTKKQLKNIALEVNFDTAAGSTHQGIAYYKFTGGHSVKVTVKKITSAAWGSKLPAAFRIRNEIFIERYYNINTSVAASSVTSGDAGGDNASLQPAARTMGIAGARSASDISGQQVVIRPGTDPVLNGFPQYDIEWTFYDDNSVVGKGISNGGFTISNASLEGLFKNNSSRVTTGQTVYQLNLIYNPGFVFHRVRGIRYNEISGVREEGPWSYTGSYAGGWGIIAVTGHEQNLNWQYNMSFAEEGKRKEVVSYFDGSLRNRQSVTLNNDITGSRTIVQENVYDALGRAAVNILPAPTEETDIHYFHDFNTSAVTGQPYHFKDIEEANTCVKMPAAMSSLTGASQYYSPNNPKKDDNSNQFYFTKYIPDAQGYPFAVTHFTPDNTGRIRSQGGVGNTFQPGKAATADDHTTQYFYGKPLQPELDRLFGNEAGNASHYLKNMVTDANGQTSVSYVNAAGKTVATALAGKTPDNLHALPSYQLKSMPYITSLVDRDNIVRDAANLTLTYSGTFLAAATGTFTLKYAFTPVSLQVLYGLQNEKICADCYYDLIIKVTDDCGNPVGQPVTQEAVFTEKTSCSPAPTKQEGQLPVTIQKAGEYNITYQLKLSRKAIDFYTDSYLTQNLSLKGELDFKRDYIHNIDISGCYNDCATCLVELGTEQAFVTKMTGVLQQSSITANADDVNWMKDSYKKLLATCTHLQEGCGKTDLPCEEQTQQLKDDVSLGGQYMLYDAATNTFIERDINILLKNKAALTKTVTINGIPRVFNSLTEAEVITNWQDSWANDLLLYHPENVGGCFIADCGKNAASEQYDKSFINTDDAGDAKTKLYWFDDDYTSVVNNDPYFKTGAEGAAKKTAFINSLKLYKGTGTDIMSFVRWQVYCQKPATGAATAITACPRTASCNRQQDEWMLFRTLYYSAKQEVLTKNTGGCNSKNIFPDPTAAMQQVVNPGATVPVSCANAAFFEISNVGGKATVKYTGTEKLAQAVTVQYFSVGIDGTMVNTGRSLVFANGAAPETVLTGSQADAPTNLTYVIDYARCDLAANHQYYTKTRRNYNGLDLSGITGPLSTPGKTPEQVNASAIAAMATDCNESCEQNADGWMKKLEGCVFTVNSTEYTQIRDGLIAVCKSSCQVNVADHPYGASSTPTATANGDKNFKEVLLRVLGAARFTEVCTDLLLDYPPPIGVTPLYANEVVRTLQSCAYDKLKAWKAAYAGTTGYSSFTDYVQKKIDPSFNLTDTEVNALMGAYENNCVTPKPIVLPASLSCSASQPKTCLSCTELQDEKINFASAYPYVNATGPYYYELLAKYINRKYNFNLSSVDIYQALQTCAASSGTGGGTTPVAISCAAFTAAYNHFELLKPDYFYNPNGNPGADSLYKIHLTLWLNTELNHQLNFDYYRGLAAQCNIAINYPRILPSCDSGTATVNCPPQFITCCEPFAELEKFKQAYPDSINARLLAVYFSLLRTQWCSPVNLPLINYTLPYDSIVHYFNEFRLANEYTIVVRPDSLISYTATSTSNCTATAVNFGTDNHDYDNEQYAICNKPAQPVLSVDQNSCINQQINVALGNAHSDYLEYIISIRRDYRDAYYAKCLSITPQLMLEAVYNQPLEYHYTLYYYDQAGNLVKTIPPAGVQPVDDATDGTAKMERIKNFRLADKDYCYEYGDAPALNGNASITVADNAVIQQKALPFTVEAFVNFNNLGGAQTILTKQSANATDNKTDGYKIYLDNGRLKCDLAAHGAENWIQTLSKITRYPWPAPYTNLPPALVRSFVQVKVPRKLYRAVTVQITSDIGGIIASNQWVHIAMQNTGDWKNPLRIYINGSLVNSELLTNTYDYTPATSPALTAAAIAAGTMEFNFSYSATTTPLNVNNTRPANLVIGAGTDGLNGGIKQVRIYNRALLATEIRNNAFNTCLVPQSEGSLVIWLPLNKQETAGVSIDRINQLRTLNVGTLFSDLYQPVYPAHKLPTHYYYNSLNAVTKQSTPDGGTSNFWYDLLGRLVASQNAEQLRSTRAELNNRYSYTKYDVLGRITEVGEKTGARAMTTAIAKSNPVLALSALNTWLTSGTNIQVTQTIYDQPNVSIVTNRGITDNQNIYNTSRKRVVATIYRNTMTGSNDYNSATHYQYDINGNVKRLWQEHKTSVTGAVINLLKDLQYDYDLVSGKVNHVIYQSGKGDQFVYKYEYDPDNRLIKAYSGRDMNTLQQDAGYKYYLHGPLARMELGDEGTSRIVQGSDYAYTLQGWLKGVNGVQLNAAADRGNDMGADGSPLNKAGIHSQVGSDALAYTLGYYGNDYTPIGGTTAVALGVQYQHPQITGVEATGKSLFNGNISNATYSIAGIDNGNTRGYSYGYDQLNRLLNMRAHDLSSVTPGSNWNNTSILESHRENFTYDANGNILQLFRNGVARDGSQLAMDDLSYNYYYYTAANIRNVYTPGQPLPADAWKLTNQLAHVNDAVPATNYPASAYPQEKDIDNQANNNYTYDGIGNLVKDNAEEIKKIGWTVYGKIRSIDKTDGTSIIYDYDAAGNRIQKQVSIPFIARVQQASTTITYYIRDAQGNTIAVYSWLGKTANAKPIAAAPGDGVTGETWDEQHLYGSSRLGMWKPNITVPTILNTITDAIQVGSKFFELSNHLGNVLAVISDKKIAVPAASDPLITDHYEAELISANDYTPFGMQMTGRSFSVASSSYRYGFNGKENDNEVKGEGNQQDYGMRVYDPRLGRFLSVDPITQQYPELTPYQFASNRPIQGIDLDGKEFYDWQARLAYNIFIKPFVDFQDGAKNYAEGTVQKTAAEQGLASYQNDKVPERVQKRLQRDDISQGIGKQISGASQMYVSTAEVVTTYVPSATEGVLAVKAGKYLLKAPVIKQTVKVFDFASWGSEYVDDALRTTEQAFNSEHASETFYRAMRQDAADAFVKTGKMPAGTETFLSPTKSYARQYGGVLFEINLKPGTVSQLESIGVRNAVTGHPFSNLPIVGKGWKRVNAFFKVEGTNSFGLPQVNIGLGNGKALNIFNSNIKSFRSIR